MPARLRKSVLILSPVFIWLAFFSIFTNSCAKKALREKPEATTELLEKISLQIQTVVGAEVTSQDLARSMEKLPVVFDKRWGWAFQGEQELRRTLRNRYNIELSTGFMPIGVLERNAPGQEPILLVFAFKSGDAGRLWALMAMGQKENQEDISQWGPGYIIGEGSRYHLLGVYARRSDGTYGPAGAWTEMLDGWTWDQSHKEVVCLPCQGWLCPNSPIACFSDSNGNGREEIALLVDHTTQERIIRLEVDASGQLTLISGQPTSSSVQP